MKVWGERPRTDEVIGSTFYFKQMLKRDIVVEIANTSSSHNYNKYHPRGPSGYSH